MKITALNNQSLIDITIQATGDASNLLLIALHNNLIPTAQPLPGQLIEIPNTVSINTDVVRHYQANGILPATALSEELATPELTCEEQLYECFK